MAYRRILPESGSAGSIKKQIMVFRIKLAENIIKIESMHSRVYSMCREYLWEDDRENADDPDICVTITQDDLDKEREKSENEGIYSDAYLETLAVYRKISSAMVDRNTFLMHGAVFAIGDAACMITAPSGTGKTTFLNQLCRISEDVFIVNGDKPLIGVDKEADEVYAFGTPWSGKENLNTNSKVPLKMICILRRGEENTMEEIGFSDALPTLLSQTYRPEAASGYVKTISLLGELKGRVKFYNLNMKMYDSMKDIETVAAEMVKERLHDQAAKEVCK